MHGKYSFIQTLVERAIQQVRKHEKQVKAYDEAFTAMRYNTFVNRALPAERLGQMVGPDGAVSEWHEFDCGPLFSAYPHWHPVEHQGVTDANPERRGNGCAIYRVNS